MGGWMPWTQRFVNGLRYLTIAQFYRSMRKLPKGSSSKDGGSRRHNFLLCLAFPWTVEALSWGGQKQKEPPVYKDPNSMEAKLQNKNDHALIQDLKMADKIYQENNGLTHQQIYKLLLRHKEKREAELHWRLARVTYELSKIAETSQQKMELIEEAYATVKLALEIDDTNFAAHKWMAIILNQLSTMKGTTEQIKQSYVVRQHMDRAAELNPRDATSVYLVGNWCFTVAEIPWYQRKVAETIFAKPPTCSFQEAIHHFLQAENIQPHFYSMNLLMLGKSYMKVGELEKAEECLSVLEETPLRTDEDYIARKEGSELLRKLRKNKKS